MKLLGKAIWKAEPELKNAKNSSQGQRSRSNVTNFQTPLAFAMGHIPTKLHQFPTRSFQDFVRTDRQTQRCTNRQPDAAKSNTCSQHSWRTGKKEFARYTIDIYWRKQCFSCPYRATCSSSDMPVSLSFGTCSSRTTVALNDTLIFDKTTFNSSAANNCQITTTIALYLKH